MTNIKTNYDIYYENDKNKIIFNIYSDDINEESNQIKNDNNKNNNNDTLNFISNIFVFIESNIYSLYEYLINNLPKYHRTFYKLQFIFLIINLLFTFAYSFEDNSNVSTHLIVSAYFPTCQRLTYIKYDKVIDHHLKKDEEEKNKIITKINDTNENDKSEDKIIACQNRYINDDLKSLMS